jgi:ferrous iron transport protein B
MSDQAALAPETAAPAEDQRHYRIALVGVPNVGKTALFNALTGSRQKVANYAGVTVERKEGAFTSPSGAKFNVLDLPGTYSLRARSPDEAVTRDAVLGRLAGETPPDVIVCVADATNLRIAVRLALELRQVGRPMVLALNMHDIAQRQGIDIDLAKLSEALGMPVAPTVATRKRGIDDLLAAIEQAAQATAAPAPSNWHEPSAAEVRAGHAAADKVVKTATRPPKRPDTWTGKIDAVVLHPVGGLAILFVLLFVMFQAVFAWATPAMDLISAAFDALGATVKSVLPESMLQSLISDGIISGVGSVLVFLPQILILFLFIILLEDLGYMARAAFLMDKLMGGAGLHGRAFIPLLSSFACAIPGIMAARVIDSRRDRLTTIMVSPLMTCSARIPVYTLIIAAFIPRQTVYGLNLQGLVMFGLYAAGIVSALIVAFVMRRLLFRGQVEPFIMELPAYKTPDPKNVLFNLLLRARIFLQRAGTIILSMMILIWFLSSVPGAPPGATQPAIDYSFAGMLGHALEPLLRPIGFNWQMTVALIPGMAAREVAVGALATVYAVSGEGDGPLGALLAAQWTLPTALSFLTWYIFAPQCMSTLGVVRRETNSWVWPAAMFGYMLVLAYAASFVVFNVSRSLLG